MKDDSAVEMRSRRESRLVDSAEMETDYQPVNWKRLLTSPKYIMCFIVLLIALVLTIIITIKHEQVVATLRPFSEKVRDLPAGWLIPIAILIIISFPPLFGHEIVALLCGVVYGLWIGFGIVAAGTFFGELATWFAFKYLFRRKAEKLERTNLNYGALARLTRDGGFWIVLLIRFSAIPSHFSTAVFSTCGVNFWAFAVATLVTLPKQIFLVYLGVLLLQEQPDGSAKNIAFGVAFAVTIVMGFYIMYRMRQAKKTLLLEQEERRRRRSHLQKAAAAAVGASDSEPEDRQWLMMEPSATGRGARDYDAVSQEEMDIGVASTGGSRMPSKVALSEPEPYGSSFEYHGTPHQGTTYQGAAYQGAAYQGATYEGPVQAGHSGAEPTNAKSWI